MSTHDYVIANAGFPTVRSDINSALGAIQTNNLSSSTPGTLAAGMVWVDSSVTNVHTIKYYDGGAHISLFTIDTDENTATAAGVTAETDPTSAALAVALS